MAQRPATAPSPGMPLRTLVQDSLDFVASPDELGLLLGYLISVNPEPHMYW
jgi:hypothetical protein